MKTLISLSVLLLAASASQAETVYRSADGSQFSEVCIAALDSRSAARNKAAELGVSGFEYQRLQCNGMPVASWVKQQNHAPLESAEDMVAINAGDPSPATELCVAALTSPDRFQEVKEQHFKRAKGLEDSLHCNGKPLKRFVMEYEEKLASASL